MSTSSTCGSCGAGFSPAQKFCGSCGQPVPTHRIDWAFLSHEVQHGLLHVDKGILFTVKHLLTRPGAFIREYIDGNRAGHFKPVLLIMILGAVATIIARFARGATASSDFLLGAYESLSADRAEGMKQTDVRMMEVLKMCVEWIGAHIPLFLVLLAPVFALAMWFAFYSRKPNRLNYPEWLVVACFCVGQALCVYIVFALIGIVSPTIGNFDLLAMMVIQGWTMLRLFTHKPWWNTVTRFLVGYAFYVIILGALLVAGGIFAAVFANGTDAFMEQVRQ